MLSEKNGGRKDTTPVSRDTSLCYPPLFKERNPHSVTPTQVRITASQHRICAMETKLTVQQVGNDGLTYRVAAPTEVECGWESWRWGSLATQG